MKPVLSTVTPRSVSPTPKTVIQKVKDIANNSSTEIKQAVSQITDVAVDHFANLSIEAIKAIVGVCISTTILTLTTLGTWCARKLLKKRSAQTVQAESLPLSRSFDNPSSVIDVEPEATAQPRTFSVPPEERPNSVSNFQGSVTVENELFHSPINH